LRSGENPGGRRHRRSRITDRADAGSFYDSAPMIHFHNGDVTAALARRAGVPGRHVPFRESLIGGPVRRDLAPLDWVEERARYLAEEHEENLLRVRNDVLEQERVIDAARQEEEIVLWFEHDLFCLVHLLYLAKRFANCRVSIVWCSTPISQLEA